MKNKLCLLLSFVLTGLVMCITSVSNVQAKDLNETEKFINEIKDYSMELAYDNDLYASVMIAQAVLESGNGKSTLSEKDNNLFGVKGSYNGKSSKYWTYEDDGSGNYYKIQAHFKKYPSFKESLEDYVILLRNGIGPGAEDFYSGTWKSNTDSWEEAAAYLQGRYATDTRYFTKLKRIIEEYNLTQYDVSLEEYYHKPLAEIIDSLESKYFLNCVQSDTNMFSFNGERGISLNVRNLITLQGLFNE